MIKNFSIPWNELTEAARVADRALGLTHPLYKYPASMSPALARALILGLTCKGDTVLDPFCGGGTTAVEAIAHGRNVICSDLNTLACFVTQAKAKQMSQLAIKAYEQWTDRVGMFLQNEQRWRSPTRTISNDFRHAPRTFALIAALRDSATQLPSPSTRRFAMLVVLRVAQLCFDRKSDRIYPAIAIRAFNNVSSQATVKMRQYVELCEANAPGQGLKAHLRVLRCDAEHLATKLGSADSPISLVLTSPPYPGVHVLYHRWQIRGRRETDLPYQLIGQSDGRYESSYTLGSRHQIDNTEYFQRLGAIYTRLREILDRSTLVAQIVAFSNPKYQLARFREAMSAAGFDEVVNPDMSRFAITRTIPNRRWYALLSSNQNSAREYLLIHRPRVGQAPTR